MSFDNFCFNSLENELSSYLNRTSNTTKYLAKNVQHKNIISSYILILGGVVFLVWCLQLLWKRRYLYWYSWGVPGPLAFPFIGAAYYFMYGTSDIMKNLIKLQKRYPLGAIWIGPQLFYFISKPEHIEKILTSPKALHKNDDIYKFVSFALGEGLLTAKVPKWRKHKKVISPSFNLKVLNSYQEIFAEKGEIFVELLQKYIGDKEINLFELLSNCQLDIICETAVGVNMNIQTTNSDFCKSLEKALEITTYRIFHVWHHLVFTWNWYPISKEYNKALKSLRDFGVEVLRRKKELYKNKQCCTNLIASNTVQDSSKRMGILDSMLENSNFTELEFREEFEIFVLAGTDTTASALCCTFTMLGMFQDIQQKVLDEILEIVGPERRVNASHLSEMKYTERVIKESLRLFPIAPFFTREVGENIDAGDMIFPAGSSIFFGPVQIHRNPEYWPDPLKFDPDRFLPENVAKRHPCTYIPFSYGPRKCIGGQYAIMAMKTILATVVRKYKIFTEYKTVEEIKLKINLTLRMKHGSKVWIEKR